MSIKLIICLLIAFAVGRLSTLKIYIGSDQAKYDAADCGIKLRGEFK